MFIDKDELGHIVGIYANAQFDGQEYQEGAALWVDPQIAIDAKLAKVREFREVTINRINGIADRLARTGNATIRAVADGAVVALLDITKNPPAEPALIDAEMVNRYTAIVAPLQVSAPELLIAFAGMDQ